jgi:hypothetical protein
MVIAASLAAAPAVFAAKESEHHMDLGPGCAPERPAIGHRAGGVVIKKGRGKDHRAPIPCVTRTTWRTSEVSLVVTSKGTLLFQPAVSEGGFPIGVIRSENQGTNWTFVPASATAPPLISAVDQHMWFDRDTGRTFWVAQNPGTTNQISRLNVSDDDGKTWTTYLPALESVDHSQIFSGPPPKALRPLMKGYPNVVYVCAGNNPQVCQSSLDGGKTFGPGVPLPIPPEVGPGCRDWGLHGVVGKDGTVFVPFAPCQRGYIAISRDAGKTWRAVSVADSVTLGAGMLSVDMDEQGNLYAAWVDFNDRLPYLAISRDYGAHWSAPLMVGAPGTKETAIPALVAGAKGHIAVTYYGSKNSPGFPFPACPTRIGSLDCPFYRNATWDTFVTETWTALEREPVFWSATLNDPDHSTWYGCSPSFIGVLGSPTGTSGCTASTDQSLPYWGRIDYYGAAMTPDGTAWIGFAQECPSGLPVSGNPNCPSTLTGARPDGLFGMLGRLVRNESESSDDDEEGNDD